MAPITVLGEGREGATAPTTSPDATTLRAPEATTPEGSSELEGPGTTLQTVHDEIEGLHAHLAAREERTRQELASARQGRREADERARRLEEELARLRASLKGALAKTSSLEATLATTTEERDALVRNWDSAEQRLEAQKAEAERTMDVLSQARDLVMQEKEEVEGLRTSLREARDQALALQRDVGSRTDQLKHVGEEMTRAIQKLKEDEASRKLLRDDLERARSRVGALETELEEARELARRPTSHHDGPVNAHRTLCVPVAFTSSDGRTVAKEALFALGKGEALETFLTSLLEVWRATGRPLVPLGGHDGDLTLALEGDPEQRSLRVLRTGAYVVRLSEHELGQVGTLPALVARNGKPLRLNP